jgi:hypothetical protein
MKMIKKFAKVLTITAAVLMVASSLALAGSMNGEIIAIEGEIFTVKGVDGTEYQIKKELIAGKDLKTGDAVAIEIKEQKPVGAKKYHDSVHAEITTVEGGVYTVKGADGKEIQIKQELVKHLDLKTGDMVEVYMEKAEPAHVKKKAKK